MSDGNGFDKKSDMSWKAQVEKEKSQMEANSKANKPNIPTLVIKALANGQINVEGPILNKPLCLYMLEVAKDLVKAAKPAPPKSHQPFYRRVTS